MYQEHRSTAQRTGSPDALELPLRILLALRGGVAVREREFNLVGALQVLLGAAGPAAARRVVRSFVFAPERSDSELASLFETPLPSGASPRMTGAVGDLRTRNFPSLGIPDAGSDQRFDIVHYGGALFPIGIGLNLAFNDDGSLRLDPAALCAGLIKASRRLLVIQSDWVDFPNCNRIAELVMQAGGPSVLCATANSIAAADAFFFEFYAGLMHNEPLSSTAARLGSQFPGLDVALHVAADGDHALDITPFLISTQNRLASLAFQPNRADALREQLGSFLDYGHNAQIRSARERIDLASLRLGDMREAANEAFTWFTQLPPAPWNHERTGILPLAEIAHLARGLEAESTLSDRLLAGLDDDLQPSNAPRVLNANFADPDSRVLGAQEAPVANSEYDLLVDVGPRWSERTSLVSGASEFPVTALPPEHDGYKIAVVFLSDEFQPHTVSGALWLPGRTGGSRPIIDGEPGAISEPIKLRLRTPGLDRGVEQRSLHGRLCLYYENNLLQSARVNATLAAAAREVATANEIVVDYLLTGAFRAVGDLQMRNVAPTRPTASAEPIAVNFTLNEEGSGTHRIVVGKDGQTVWFHSDPIGANRLLEEVRATLGDCYWRRDYRGNVVRDREGNRTLALNAENGKSRAEFMWDMLNLARLGSRLFGLLFNNVTTTDGRSPLQGWPRSGRAWRKARSSR